MTKTRFGSLRWTLLGFFLPQLLITVGLVGWLSFRYAQDAVYDLSQHLHIEITERISEQLKSFLKTPQQIIQQNLNLYKQGLIEVDPLNRKQWQQYFAQQMQLHPTVGSIGLATEQRIYTALRRGEIDEILLSESLPETNFNLESHDYKTGEATQLIKPIENFDVRGRSWYKKAAQHQNPVWSDIYQSLDFKMPFITAGVPIRKDQQLLGVFFSTLRLQYISDFLKTLTIGETGQAFIIDRNGALIGSSKNENLIIKEGAEEHPRLAIQSTDEVTAGISQFLQKEIPLSQIQLAKSAEIEISGKKFFSQTTPFKDEYGLDWLIVVVIPQNDFMKNIHQSAKVTFLLISIFIIISIFLSLVAANYFIEPLSSLTKVVNEFTTEQWQKENKLTDEIKRKDEIGLLANAFLQMSAQLQDSFKQLQQEVKTRSEAQQAAEMANHAKTIFLSNMSHELRTPLNSILGYAQIIREDQNLDEIQREGIDTILNSGEYLLTLINDVLDLARFETHKIELSFIEFDFQNFLNNIIFLFDQQAQNKGLMFSFLATTSLPVGVRTDEKRLRQILICLLGNALKFTPSGGINFRVSYQNGMAQFEVEDTGIGIEPLQMQRLFQPFPINFSQPYYSQGLGIGLALTKKFINLLNGTIHVESEVEKGSLFRVIIPLKEIKHFIKTTNSSHPMISGYCGEKRYILVIDDHWSNRAMLANLLKPLGFEIYEASNGIEGLSKLEQHHIDLVLTDLVMPTMDGFEVARQIRRHRLEHIRKTPIIALSASVLDFTRQEAEVIGYSAFILKPIRPDELLSILKQHLHLEWKHEMDAEVVTPSIELKVPSQSHIALTATLLVIAQNHLNLLQAERLSDLAKIGDLTGILGVLNRWEKQNTELLPLVQTLRGWVSHFCLDELSEFSHAVVEHLKKDKTNTSS